MSNLDPMHRIEEGRMEDEKWLHTVKIENKVLHSRNFHLLRKTPSSGGEKPLD